MLFAPNAFVALAPVLRIMKFVLMKNAASYYMASSLKMKTPVQNVQKYYNHLIVLLVLIMIVMVMRYALHVDDVNFKADK